MARLSLAFLVDSVPFTKAVCDGETSLGGSESACLGLARALKAKGHDVHVFATNLAEDAVGVDPWDVIWHPLDTFRQLNQFWEWDVVIGLRQPGFFTTPLAARLRVLWNQDLLTPAAGNGVMSIAWALDKSVYVSEYHRRQWEDIQPELAPLGVVTKNGFDPALVPTDAVKDPHRIIHVSRPERGLGPLLAMWPEFRKRHPQATLQVCRYQSMYDGEGSNVRASCLAFDARVEAVNAAVGGITYLGSLNKAQLSRAIADAAVMWYPGIASFAETSCIAAIEAQACGTPFVGSLRGALPETAYPSFEAGLLIGGDADAPEYQQASMAAVERLLDGCARQSFEYRTLQQAGRTHVESYTYAALADEWEQMIEGWFAERYQANTPRILRQLLHEDDHTAAQIVAEELGDQTALAFCQHVIQGHDQVAEDYAAYAIQDVLYEVDQSGRFKAVSRYFDACTSLLDVACGNGAAAIRFALDHPTLRVVGFDYAEPNILRAREAAEKAGVADRCTFQHLAVWDLEGERPAETTDTIAALGPYDGLFVGEFLEHVADCTRLVDYLDAFLTEGAAVVYTCPMGPFMELATRGTPIKRGHVHCFMHDDVRAVFGQKRAFGADFFDIGVTPRGNPVGHWLIHYTSAPDRPAGRRDYATRIQRTRPQQKVSVGIIAKDAENDLGRCLASIWPIVDEIVVGDTGSSDDTVRIAESYGARVLTLPPIEETREGFAGARNAVLDACTGDWFLWIDTDETLIEPWKLRGFLQGSTYNGYVLHQNHLYLDGPPTYDKPIRLFRRTPDIRFYGCIHEQPQAGDANTDILPSLDLSEPSIAHTGYLTQEGREDKRVHRNRPLLKRDQQVFPERLLGKVLLIREAVIEADARRVRAGGLTTNAAQGYQHAIAMFERYFSDPSHKMAVLARPWYEAALRHLGAGWEFEWAFAGSPGGMDPNRHAKPERVHVKDADDLKRLVAHRLTSAAEKMAPITFKTDPVLSTSREQVAS
jgi:glycosyltransferase involved in cell wall biosynthesis/2-polyprenyl-3-methyl-5-hydroxy-6-metoxy-1,4-benzoquinol methylase